MASLNDGYPLHTGKGAAIAILLLWYLAFVGQSFLALKFFPRLRGTRLFRLFSSK
jgi:hypothetical protein